LKNWGAKRGDQKSEKKGAGDPLGWNKVKLRGIRIQDASAPKKRGEMNRKGNLSPRK